MKPAWYMQFAEIDDDCELDRTGGLPTHLPVAYPTSEYTGDDLHFLAQFYCSGQRLSIPDTLCVHLYQELDEPVPVAVRVPINAQPNEKKLGRIHPNVKRCRIEWTDSFDPDEIPESAELTDDESKLMESKIGGTPYYTDDELAPGHTYLLQLGEEPADFNFGGRKVMLTISDDGELHVRLQ